MKSYKVYTRVMPNRIKLYKLIYFADEIAGICQKAGKGRTVSNDEVKQSEEKAFNIQGYPILKPNSFNFPFLLFHRA